MKKSIFGGVLFLSGETPKFVAGYTISYPKQAAVAGLP